MDRGDSSFAATLRHPSAFLPLAMSLAALAFLLGDLAVFGVTHETDEGAVAHIWQLLMAGQIPLIAFFAFKRLPHSPRQTLYVLGLQIAAAFASVAPVYLLHL